MKYFIIILFYFSVKLGNSQNLVSNPSFEVYSSCPDNASQLTLAIGWTAPTNNDADYFNSCASSQNHSVPYQGIYNFQLAKTGNAYAGFYALNGPGGNYREYIQSQLNLILSVSECYYVEFYINLMADLKYAVNNVGLHFSNNAINSTGAGFVLDLEPQILKLNNPIISDTMNWVKISGIYRANGGEQFITIGNFNYDVETDTLNVDNNGYFGAYYLIDDVSVVAISDLPNFMSANAGPDIHLTEGDSVFIGQEISNLNCTWSILGGAEIADSISGIYVQPTENTTYVVEQELCGVTTYDTVTVFVHGVGLEESSPLPPSKGGIALSPNPNNGSFEIDLSKLNAPIQDLSILDASGRMVYQEKNVASSNKLNIQTHLEKGVYFLRVSSEKGIFEEKIVIQ